MKRIQWKPITSASEQGADADVSDRVVSALQRAGFRGVVWSKDLVPPAAVPAFVLTARDEDVAKLRAAAGHVGTETGATMPDGSKVWSADGALFAVGGLNDELHAPLRAAVDALTVPAPVAASARTEPATFNAAVPRHDLRRSPRRRCRPHRASPRRHCAPTLRPARFST